MYARNLGVNVDDLLVCQVDYHIMQLVYTHTILLMLILRTCSHYKQPDSGEMALDVVDQLIRSAALDIIVVDSVAALVRLNLVSYYYIIPLTNTAL